MSKRTLDSFFKSEETTATKKTKTESSPSDPPREDSKPDEPQVTAASHHSTYPFPISGLPSHISTVLSHRTPRASPRRINDQPHLDLLYYEPYIPAPTAREYFQLLRRELPFYRVRYTIRRGPTETVINTPRFTTVFGVDATSKFITSGLSASSDENSDLTKSLTLVDSQTNQPIRRDKYNCNPRPIPACLDLLRQRIEAAIGGGTIYNFCLMNYYASGDDSISYHSDDERFLGANPNIASLSLGAKRDFLMKHKPPSNKSLEIIESKPVKLSLASGDMVVMKGETQSNWLHSVPKRKGGEANTGRINITFRKAVVPGGTENYYRYNVGDGTVHRWNEEKGQMVPVGQDHKAKT